MEFLSLPRTTAHMSFCFSSPCDLALCNNEGKLITFSHCRRYLCLGKSKIQKPITCAGNRRRQYGSSRSVKLLLQSAYNTASRFNIVPAPLDFLINLLGNAGGGNGGGFRIPKGGSGWEGSDGCGKRRERRRRSTRRVAFLCVAVVLGLGIWMVLGKEFTSDVLLRVLGFMVLGLSVCEWKTTRFRDWALGFSSCAALVGLAMKKEDFQKLMNNIVRALEVNFKLRKRKLF